MKLLSELVEFCEKGANLQKDLKGDVLFIPSGAVFPESIKSNKCYKILLSTTKLKEEYYLKKDDVLFNTGGVGTLGRVGFFNLDDKAVCDPFVLMIRGKKNVLHNRYLFYQLQTPRIKDLIFKNTVGSTGITAIKKTDILSFPIILPPYEEQQRIATILDKAQNVVQKQKARIEKYDVLAQSVFTEMFGDPIMNEKGFVKDEFNQGLNKIESGWSPVCLETKRTEDDQWAVIKLGAISTRKFIAAENKLLPSILVPRSNIEIKKGDILFTRKNTYELVGAAVYVSIETQRLIMPDTVFRFDLKHSKLNPVFLTYLFNHYKFRKVIQSLASGSSGSMPNISKEKLGELEIIYPNIDKQEKFEKILEVISIQILKTERSLIDSLNLFNNILQKTFKSNLVSQNEMEVMSK
jgi:type I restriction enzyme S subunit